MFEGFVLAFLFGGVLAAVFQLAAGLTHAKPPVLLTIGFALGGVLLPTGIIAWAEMWGGGGMAAMVLDAGAALAGNFLTLITAGVPIPLLIVLATFVLLVLIGCLTGAISKPQGEGRH